MAIPTASINIPKEDLVVLKKISKLENQQFNSLLSVIRAERPTFSRRQFVHNIAAKVKTIQKADIATILRVVFILYSMKGELGSSAQELSKDIVKSYSELCSKDHHISHKQVTLLNIRLKHLLSCDKTVAVTAKASDVMTEHAHTFCRARILSDIRPVFTDSATSASAAVIIHNLQIGFHEAGSGDHKEFYVALDTDDIKVLKEVVERAEKRTIALESILKTSKVPYLEV